jgi:hypothetical protein
MIWLLAQQSRLDLQRGANLTEQSLLELDVENFSYSGRTTLKGCINLSGLQIPVQVVT